MTERSLSELEITPETLPAVTRLITSLREQKGKSSKAIRLIDKAIRAADSQVKYLEKLKVERMD